MKQVIFQTGHWQVVEDLTDQSKVLRWQRRGPYTIVAEDGGVPVHSRSAALSSGSVPLECSRCNEFITKAEADLLTAFLKLVRSLQ